MYRELDNNAEKKDIVMKAVQLCIREKNLNFLSWMQEIKGMPILPVKREIQRNDWLSDYLEEELRNYNFQTTKEFSYNKFSIFGRSRPDFAFFKQGNLWIKAGIIVQTTTEELMNIHLYGTAVELKIDISQDPSNVLPQAFADTVRVSNNLLIDALKVGKIVNCQCSRVLEHCSRDGDLSVLVCLLSLRFVAS